MIGKKDVRCNTDDAKERFSIAGQKASNQSEFSVGLRLRRDALERRTVLETIYLFTRIYSPSWRRHLRQARLLITLIIDDNSRRIAGRRDQVTLHDAEDFEIHREHPWHFRPFPCQLWQLDGKRQTSEKDESDHSTSRFRSRLETVRSRCR